MGHVDTRSPESAYASKPNIVHPGTAAQATAAAAIAAQNEIDATSLTQDSSVSRTGAQVSKTKNVKR